MSQPSSLQNAFDFVLFTSVFGYLLYSSVATWEKFKTKMVPSKPDQPLSYLFLSSIFLLTFTEIWQIVDKAMRGWIYLVNLAFPCHAITIILLYAVFIRSSNYRRSCFLFNLVIYMYQFDLVAMTVAYLFPESFIPEDADEHAASQHITIHGMAQLDEMKILVFWCHHIALAVVPLWASFSRYFHIIDPRDDNYDGTKQTDQDSSQKRFMLYNTCISAGTLYAYNVELPLALISEQNVNFMLEPPPLSLLQGQFYRLKVMPLLYFGTILCRKMAVTIWRSGSKNKQN